MATELLFVLAFAVMVVAIILIGKNRRRIGRVMRERLKPDTDSGRRNTEVPQEDDARGESGMLSSEEWSEAEWRRLQEQIEERKQIARNVDIAHHLWGFYITHFRSTPLGSPDRLVQDGEWYDVKILQSGSRNGLNRFKFELKGARYQFVDNEENQGWGDNIKYFSLFLYDDSGRCLIEIPMKVKVDKWGRKYSIMSDQPKAFLPGGWVNDFIHVKLKYQHIRNQEIREQKHQERLWEIEDLKNRFGISD